MSSTKKNIRVELADDDWRLLRLDAANWGNSLSAHICAILRAEAARIQADYPAEKART